MSTKVVHMTTVHRWDDTRIFRKQCQALLHAGYEVILLAPIETSGVQQGIYVRSLPIFHSRVFRILIAPWLVLYHATQIDAKIYHFHDPELIFTGLFLKIFRKKIVFDVHENISQQILSKYWIPSIFRKSIAYFYRCIERLSSHFFDGIVVATPAISGQFPKGKACVVQNFPCVKDMDVKFSEGVVSNLPSIAYVGIINQHRGLKELVCGLDEVEGVQLNIAGSFSSKKIENEIRSLAAWNKVNFLGWCDRAQVAELLADAVAGIVCFLPSPNHIDSQPNKLFEYMSAGLPVIASNFPLWKQIICGHDCGIVVDPKNPSEIAKAIKWLINNPKQAKEMGERGRKAVQEKYNWSVEFSKLDNLYRNLLLENNEFEKQSGMAA